jgi:hypothetical protein
MGTKLTIRKLSAPPSGRTTVRVNVKTKLLTSMQQEEEGLEAVVTRSKPQKPGVRNCLADQDRENRVGSLANWQVVAQATGASS